MGKTLRRQDREGMPQDTHSPAGARLWRSCPVGCGPACAWATVWGDVAQGLAPPAGQVSSWQASWPWHPTPASLPPTLPQCTDRTPGSRCQAGWQPWGKTGRQSGAEAGGGEGGERTQSPLGPLDPAVLEPTLLASGSGPTTEPTPLPPLLPSPPCALPWRRGSTLGCAPTCAGVSQGGAGVGAAAPLGPASARRRRWRGCQVAWPRPDGCSAGRVCSSSQLGVLPA